MSKQKKNPVIPLKQSQIRKIKNEAVEKAMSDVTALFLMTLRDKEGYDMAGLKKVFREVNDLAVLVSEDRISLPAIHKILYDEAGIKICFKGGASDEN